MKEGPVHLIHQQDDPFLFGNLDDLLQFWFCYQRPRRVIGIIENDHLGFLPQERFEFLQL